MEAVVCVHTDHCTAPHSVNMIPTQAFLEQRYEVFNRQMFGGRLPAVSIVLSNAKSFFGKCTYLRHRNAWGRVRYTDFRLHINTRLDLPEQDVEDILIHEMIHLYIAVNRLKDSSSHGTIFRKMMNDINTAHGRHVTISYKPTAQQREQLQGKRQEWRLVAEVQLCNGETGFKVLPRTGTARMRWCSTMRQLQEVKDVTLYATDNRFFSGFPRSSAFKVHIIDKTELHTYLNDAQRLDADAGTIKG